MNFKIAEQVGEDVSSRHAALAIRDQIESSSGQRIVDFEGVRSVSWSFADELFGVLLRDHGEQWLSENVRIRRADAEVKYTILEAIQSRATH